MGSPIGSLMTDVIMNHVVDKALDLTPPSHRPNFFYRCVGDCFATFPNPSSIDIFLTNLNNIHNRLQFTKELQIHNSLTFLDVFKEKTNSGIKTSTYHKPTKTNLQTKYTSFSPLHYKRNLVNNLSQRSYSIFNSYATIDSEFQSIKDTLLKNGYPLSFTNKCIRQFFNRKFNPKRPKQSQTNLQLIYSLDFLFWAPFSTTAKKELHQYTKTHLPHSKLRFIHNTNKLKQQFLVKDPQRQLTRSNIGNRLNCSCGSFYIGQTRRNLVKRLEEHQLSPNSELCNYLQFNLFHKVDFNYPQIFTSCPDKHNLLILESLYIQLLKPNLNVHSSSYPLRLFNA